MPPVVCSNVSSCPRWPATPRRFVDPHDLVALADAVALFSRAASTGRRHASASVRCRPPASAGKLRGGDGCALPRRGCGRHSPEQLSSPNQRPAGCYAGVKASGCG